MKGKRGKRRGGGANKKKGSRGKRGRGGGRKR